MRDPVSVSLRVSSSETEARLNRTVVAAATSARHTGTYPLQVSVCQFDRYSPDPRTRERHCRAFPTSMATRFHPRWVRPAAEAMVARLAPLELVALSSSRRTSATGVSRIRSQRLSRWCGRRPQPGANHEDISEHLPRYLNLGHLECDVAAVAHDLRTDPDQLRAGWSATTAPPSWASPASA